MNRDFDVAVIGGGFSGLSVVLHLAMYRPALRIGWVRGHEAGFGLAYRTTDPTHLLNVRAQRMSAWAKFDDDFVHWLHRRHPARYGATDFVPRRVYAEYLAHLDAELPATVQRIDAQAERAMLDGRWQLILDSGATLSADHCVLATGNPAIRDPMWADGPRLVRDFWAWRLDPAWQMPPMSSDSRVLIVGSGLSAADAAMSLLDAGYAGELLMMSPSGRLPQLHAAAPPSPVDAAAQLSRKASALHYFSTLRRLAGEHDWRAIVDDLRCHSSALWRALDLPEQRRFMRHAWSLWNQHRHRMAPQVHARLVAHRRFSVQAARVMGVDADGRAYVRRRGCGDTSMQADLVINCSGPAYASGLLGSALMRGLLADGLVHAHPSGLGIATPEVDGLHAIGPLLLGERLETTAVPELRQQADAIAVRIGRPAPSA